MIRPIAAVLGALLLLQPVRAAEDASTLQEIRELKLLMEQQMKRIDELTVQVGRLHQAVEAQKAAVAPGPAPKRDVVGPPPYSGMTELKPAPSKPEVAKPEPATPAEAPKADLTPGLKHTVAKGETLTSIAKSYNIPLADLQKANKDVNDRKLQIGQIVTVPVTKPSEQPTTDQKENP